MHIPTFDEALKAIKEDAEVAKESYKNLWISWNYLNGEHCEGIAIGKELSDVNVVCTDGKLRVYDCGVDSDSNSQFDP